MNKFIELGLNEAMAKALAGQGIADPMEIQKLAIPKALAGDNFIGQAPTGTGKTLAYLLPADRVLFAGFLPPKSAARRTLLESLKASGQTS